MAICKFFQQGYCKFGNSCRFEHINPGARNQTPNRFAAFGGGAQNQAGGINKYGITADIIERDLTIEVPQWIFSAYAPGKDTPGQLFGGFPREQSFEEIRHHYWLAKASGNEQQALNQAQELYNDAQQQMQNAVRNSQQAVQFIVGEENHHPNRQDICRQGTQGAPFGEFLVGKRPKSLVSDPGLSNPFGNTTNTSSPFGGAPAATSAFGQPSALGQRASPFGASSFGQPSQPPGASGFGQPSTTSAFGQPSQGASPFGQPSKPPTSAFGQPSQPPASAFGQPSALGAKPSPFGAPSFGQPSQPNPQGSTFGQPSQLGQNQNAFGTMANANSNASPFAAANNAAANSNPFGAPSSNRNNGGPFASNSNNQTNSSNPFGQPSQPATNPFGQPSVPAPANPFASTNQGPNPGANIPFAQASGPQANVFQSQNQQQTNNPFGQPSNPAPFGQPANNTNQQANPFGSVQLPVKSGTTGNPYPPGSSKQHPPPDSYASKGMDGRLSIFMGKPVAYKDDKPGIREFDGTWKRIWFPDGPPAYTKDTELRPEQYDEKSREQWMAFAQTGNFDGGVMPELPPPRECTVWTF